MHLEIEGDNAPTSDQSSGLTLATDGVWASGRQHSIQDLHADGGFGLLSRKPACPPSRTDERFITTLGRFDQGTLAIASLTIWPDTLPLAQCILFNPQRQAAAPTQIRFIFRPVLHLEGHFRNMMTPGGIVLIWHGVQSKKPQPQRTFTAFESEVHQRLATGMAANTGATKLDVWYRVV